MTASTEDPVSAAESSSDQSCSLSFWLLPSPQDPAEATLTKAIESFSYPQRQSASVPFSPHVTLLGGVPCPSINFFYDKLLPRLREGIQQDAATSTAALVSPTGSNKSVHCDFYEQPVWESTWNQACLLVLKETEEFTNLVELCRDLVSDVLQQPEENEDEAPKKDDGYYPPPLHKPHLSLYYGSLENVPTGEEIAQQLGSQPLSFEASRIAIWRTNPASVQGVAKWEELAVIDLKAPHSKMV